MPNNVKIQVTATQSLVGASELPLIQQGDNILISAQFLHKKLKVKTRFNDWFNRQVADYGFEVEVDFYSNLSKSTGGRPSTDFLLTLDTAKELAMVEKSEIGRAIRKAFIAAEKAARGISVLPPAAGLFKGLKSLKINGRELFPYREVLNRCGYSAKASGSHRIHTYPGHFVKEGKNQYVTRELAQHLFHQKQVANNRLTLRAQQPVLPFDFGTAPLPALKASENAPKGLEAGGYLQKKRLKPA